MVENLVIITSTLYTVKEIQPMEKILIPYTLEAGKASTIPARDPFRLTRKNAFLDYFLLLSFLCHLSADIITRPARKLTQKEKMKNKLIFGIINPAACPT